jgi:hypothetical protein
MEAGWEKTLTGIPKEIYQLWQEYLQRRGYKIALGFLGTRRWMSALGPGRVKTFFLPQKLQAAGRDPRGRDRLSIFLLYRVWSQSGRNLEPC